MGKKSISLIMVFFIVVLFYAGTNPFSNESNEIITFSDGVMSFDYPDSFSSAEYTKHNINASGDILNEIAYFKGKNTLHKHNFIVFKNVTATSATELINNYRTNVESNSSDEIAYNSIETNPNGVVVEKIIGKQDDTLATMSFNMVFKVKDTVYLISVYGFESDEQEINETANTIFQSIK
ncbi:hypothetical protein [Methanobacterium ferruginis]|uniref:hypothetical protein n=1 Tax=Methanobacterium ferruginis TaxID=710191 RepID=UPI0025735440|nr:hypothetical protein [Methanobacterium ferruginis]BDZ68600.1 hypothetical protein GCM10025860_20480 [Methanobacterium ferruginis]